MTEFGRLLKEHRKKLGLTQKELINKLCDSGYTYSLSGSIISKWEGGKAKPPEDVVETLEDILSIPKGLLLRAAGYRAAAESREREAYGTEIAEAPLKSEAKMLYLANIFEMAKELDEVITTYTYSIWWCRDPHIQAIEALSLKHKVLYKEHFIGLPTSQKFKEYFNEWGTTANRHLNLGGKPSDSGYSAVEQAAAKAKEALWEAVYALC